MEGFSNAYSALKFAFCVILRITIFTSREKFNESVSYLLGGCLVANIQILFSF